jgi:hypothetical protein
MIHGSMAAAESSQLLSGDAAVHASWPSSASMSGKIGLTIRRLIIPYVIDKSL